MENKVIDLKIVVKINRSLGVFVETVVGNHVELVWRYFSVVNQKTIVDKNFKREVVENVIELDENILVDRKAKAVYVEDSRNW